MALRYHVPKYSNYWPRVAIQNKLRMLNNYINYYDKKYGYLTNNPGAFGPTPSWERMFMYAAAKREKALMNRAAKRIQRVVRTRQKRKQTARTLSYHSPFRRLNEKNQRAILSKAFPFKSS